METVRGKEKRYSIGRGKKFPERNYREELPEQTSELKSFCMTKEITSSIM